MILPHCYLPVSRAGTVTVSVSVYLMTLFVVVIVNSSGSMAVGTAPIDDESKCRRDLGMNSGAIPDGAISASSAYDEKSVGPKLARIRIEKNGGAWCPRPQIGKDTYEWLEVDLGELKVISVVETQGRFGNGQGQEYAPNYRLDYQRESGGHWFRFRDRRGNELLKGNSNTYLAELRELRPPIIARRVRFVPYSSHPRTVCMRVELYGCSWSDGLVSYDMRQGDRRGSDMEFYDFTYDGSVSDGRLSGGLGQLVDFETGNTNFRLDVQNLGHKGYEWVGWRNDTTAATLSSSVGSPQPTALPPVEIVFRFDQVRNFSSVIITANNAFSRDVSVFKTAFLLFSIGGQRYPGPPVIVELPRDEIEESIRSIVLPIGPGGRLGRYVRLLLAFDQRWIMISEIRFVSEPYNETIEAESDDSDDTYGPPFSGHVIDRSLKDDVNNEDRDDSIAPDDTMEGLDTSGRRRHQRLFQTSVTPLSENAAAAGEEPEMEPRRRLDDTYVGIIVGALAVFIVLIIAVSCFIAVRMRRKKYGGNGNGGSSGSPSKFIYSRNVPAASLESRLFGTSRVNVGGISGTAAEKALMMTNGSAAYNTIIVDIDGTKSNGRLLRHNTATVGTVSQQYPPTEKMNGKVSIINGAERPIDLNVYATLSRPLDDRLDPPPFASIVCRPPSSAVNDVQSPPSFCRFQPLAQSCDSLTADRVTTEGDDSVLETSLRTPSTPTWENFADLEFPRENLVVVEKLGNGVFGEVLLCKALLPVSDDCVRTSARTQLVAVKTLRPSATKQSEMSFYNELELMSAMRDPNVVHVVGVCWSRFGDEPLSIVFEYLDFGDLHQFLVDSYPDYQNPVDTKSKSKYRVLSYGCLIYMATQIASGMKYLETLNMVHRDLATRNCLVGHKYHIKISDFGVSRSLYSSDYHRMDGKVLPVRWMAWESVLLDRYSCKSDVWSFAVTLWEILTFAVDRPFSALSDLQVVENCRRCYQQHEPSRTLAAPVVHLSQPANCPREIYDLMVECWNRDSSQRPSFREIHMFLQRKNMGYSPTDEWRPTTATIVDIDDQRNGPIASFDNWSSSVGVIS